MTSAAAAAVVAAGGIVVAASPAMAAGGGCIDYSRNRWNVGVCISAPSAVYGDIYVNTRGSLGGECYIELSIIRYTSADAVEGTVASRIDGCNAGHHSAISATKYSGKRYRMFARVFVNQVVVDAGSSPVAY
ncbi:hypothetical protein OWR29_26415 [Actinoplanes sp. Pm04-4]|uniref:Uncharacterized protein n=1 Tax=Paractinoplanes pyxinae TaxID=2997416 RepID=A0ABT4B4W7_9ACTN|nr:hypothetical protein [Actinoplanes pyxinae]MCY1141547.1 hypothetical protein [Actinoplanes pyxinae]